MKVPDGKAAVGRLRSQLLDEGGRCSPSVAGGRSTAGLPNPESAVWAAGGEGGGVLSCAASSTPPATPARLSLPISRSIQVANSTQTGQGVWTCWPRPRALRAGGSPAREQLAQAGLGAPLRRRTGRWPSRAVWCVSRERATETLRAKFTLATGPLILPALWQDASHMADRGWASRPEQAHETARRTAPAPNVLGR